ncbi:DNA/RNA non-specific endonuclease [Emticicia sp. BO119]|uniref:DNA/RNA non-specific endonuclease n=1 Tax=Emticicia sp. BO119 TaxID=2757768 RepID=UPI0015F0DFD9|nr:DNA/RNA non-specific endonuclease [Emticicia sp. BO119]MBA4850686.1 DNA/RNA non-specific endonuclease [Emticicia sp. BO119]
MKSNRIILILIFFAVGYFLYYKDRPGPISKLWESVSNVFKTKDNPNPYKAPEPDNEATATKDGNDTEANATNKKKTENNTKEEEGSLFDKLKETVLGKDEQDENVSGDYEIPGFALPAINKSDEIVKHKNYTLRYEEKYEVPAWVVHKLRGGFTKGKASRGDNQFIPDKKVEGNSALSTDYSNSGYDRGHMVPAGDFKCCQDLMNETFFMSNICPQVPDFNRGIWENIESRIRGWAVRDEELYVVTGPVLTKGMKTIGRYNKVAVPKSFFKIVLYYNPKNPKNARAIAFLLPNEALFGKRMNSYVVSVDEVERVTGLDFFAKLPDDVEHNLEADSDWEAWTRVQ